MTFNPHNNNLGIHLKRNSIFGEEDVLKDTVVGENKVSMEYEYDHDVVLRHTRNTEKGVITHNKRLSIAMIFQGNPILLLAL